VQSNLVLDCIQCLYDAGITVRSVTCDGTEVNMRMFRDFGVSMDDPCFDHPSNPEIKIFAVCDVCHMLKLVRNTLGDMKIMLDGNKNQIRWAHISNIFDTQESAGLRAANKLSSKHIQYQKHKMKVKLATQVLSSSVADALDFLRSDCGDVKQHDNEATVKFIRTFDQLFDILNSHSPFACGFKAALRANNMRYWTECLGNFREYISGLQSGDGVSMLTHRRKTAFVGLVISINSVIGLATELLTRDVAPFQYFLTYKLSQDHLELFFCKVRSRGGFNNNPSVLSLELPIGL